MADYRTSPPFDRRKTARHGPILREQTIPVQLHVVAERKLEIIERVWPAGVPRDLHSLPWCEIQVNVPFRLLDLLFHPPHLALHIHIVFTTMRLEVGELPFQLHDRFLEVERLRVHES